MVCPAHLGNVVSDSTLESDMVVEVQNTYVGLEISIREKEDSASALPSDERVASNPILLFS
jgi:hypothetical protein